MTFFLVPLVLIAIVAGVIILIIKATSKSENSGSLIGDLIAYGLLAIFVGGDRLVAASPR